MKRIVLALALVGGLVSSAAAQGNRQQHGARRQQILQRFDQNHDGQLDRREKRQAKRFLQRKRFERRMVALRRFDANHDGWLSPEEQRAARDAFKARRAARGARGARGAEEARPRSRPFQLRQAPGQN